MAFITDTTIIPTTRTRPTFWQSIGRAFMAYADARSRRDQVMALQAKTDEELEAMGIRRDRIVHHVFRDLIYI